LPRKVQHHSPQNASASQHQSSSTHLPQNASALQLQSSSNHLPQTPSITTPVIINIEQNASASQQIIVFRCQSAVPEGAPHQQPFPEFAPRNYEEHCTGRPSRQDCAIGRHARQGQTFQDCAIGRHARQEQTSGSVPRQARQGQTFGSAPRQFQSHGSSSRQGHGSSLRQDRTGPGCEWRRLITRGPG
jgi:hypothetical protein